LHDRWRGSQGRAVRGKIGCDPRLTGGIGRRLLSVSKTRPVQHSLALTLLSQIVIAWVAVSLVVALTFGIVAARLGDRRRFRDRRGGALDRRSGSPDRRIGLPDPRPHPVERRMGRRDRRAGPRDRRRLPRREPSLSVRPG
jgi:hypothetical protein